MKLKISNYLIMISVLFLAKSYASEIEHTFYPYSDIFSPVESSRIKIVSEQSNYVAKYDVSDQMFERILVDFDVMSPISESSQGYILTLNQSRHYCDSSPLIGVDITIDGTVLQEGDSLIEEQVFTESNSVNKWRSHELNFSYPTILQTDSEKICNGFAGVVVELSI
ncbi:hypothetical protein MSG34_06935 [Vibrio sp. 1CM2L]|uniref:hypothetical protein n=1 Tax=Vibrio sp. 1CM2L TaxID=2929166 RepID=UPI0020BDC3E3|nr:hypothetical protein [Vibrio sp. 1CM2L]MCK8075885.1 hypothetical protein [Vibrio sp. 1CM2L]